MLNAVRSTYGSLMGIELRPTMTFVDSVSTGHTSPDYIGLPQYQTHDLFVISPLLTGYEISISISVHFVK